MSEVRRILLTGANGMVGRNVQEHSECASYELLIPSRSELDLLDGAAVSDFISDQRIDLIVHAAGRVGGIQANIREPVSFLTENVEIARNVILGAQRAGVKRFLNLASSCMYPRNGLNPLREEIILTGQLEPTNEGYAIAKIFATKLCEYISRESPEFSYKTFIPCNLYGPYDKFAPESSHMVPAIIRKLHEAKVLGTATVDIWGDGNARREFMYAGDLADCIWSSISRFDELPSVANVGLGKDWSINEYYEIAAEVVGYEGGFVHDLTKPTGMRQKLVDIERMTNFGWSAKTTLRAGLFKTYEFYKTEISK